LTFLTGLATCLRLRHATQISSAKPNQTEQFFHHFEILAAHFNFVGFRGFFYTNKCNPICVTMLIFGPNNLKKNIMWK